MVPRKPSRKFWRDWNGMFKTIFEVQTRYKRWVPWGLPGYVVGLNEDIFFVLCWSTNGHQWLFRRQPKKIFFFFFWLSMQWVLQGQSPADNYQVDHNELLLIASREFLRIGTFSTFFYCKHYYSGQECCRKIEMTWIILIWSTHMYFSQLMRPHNNYDIINYQQKVPYFWIYSFSPLEQYFDNKLKEAITFAKIMEKGTTFNCMIRWLDLTT